MLFGILKGGEPEVESIVPAATAWLLASTAPVLLMTPGLAIFYAVLVAITPSCGTVNTLGAVIVGLLAGIVCSFAIGLKFRFGFDDSLDVVGVHFVGGVVGVLLIGLLATEVMTAGPQGLFYGGGLAQLGKQALGAVVVAVYAFTVSYALAKLIDRVMGFRVSAEDEATGVDFTQHAETAYAEGVHGHLPSRRPAAEEG
jgi:Amt family ammonium transporter